MTSSPMIGRQAEAAARVYLEMRGYTVLEQNFRRPRCEIDIIATKDKILYFVEVKYRHNDDHGSGLEAITATKLRQMAYAAEVYVQETKWQGEYQLAAIELAGADFAVMGFVDDVYF